MSTPVLAVAVHFCLHPLVPTLSKVVFFSLSLAVLSLQTAAIIGLLGAKVTKLGWARLGSAQLGSAQLGWSDHRPSADVLFSFDSTRLDSTRLDSTRPSPSLITIAHTITITITHHHHPSPIILTLTSNLTRTHHLTLTLTFT